MPPTQVGDSGGGGGGGGAGAPGAGVSGQGAGGAGLRFMRPPSDQGPRIGAYVATSRAPGELRAEGSRDDCLTGACDPLNPPGEEPADWLGYIAGGRRGGGGIGWHLIGGPGRGNTGDPINPSLPIPRSIPIQNPDPGPPPPGPPNTDPPPFTHPGGGRGAGAGGFSSFTPGRGGAISGRGGLDLNSLLGGLLGFLVRNRWVRLDSYPAAGSLEPSPSRYASDYGAGTAFAVTPIGGTQPTTAVSANRVELRVPGGFEQPFLEELARRGRRRLYTRGPRHVTNR